MSKFPTREQVLVLIEHAPERLRQVLVENLRPAIGIVAHQADDASMAIGASKIGGAPDVPLGFEWPLWKGKPLGFVAQFNLEEVAPFDVEHALPESGMLSFFYAIEEQPFGDVEDAGAWRVHWWPREVELERRTPPSEPNAYSFHSFNSLPSHLLDFAIEWVWPREGAVQLADAGEIDSEIWWQLSGVPEEADLIPELRAHRLLGYAEPTQHEEDAPMLSYCRANREEPQQSEDLGLFYDRIQRTEAGQWRLLFQLEEQAQPEHNGVCRVDWEWGESMYLYFCIHADDLAARRFDQVWMLKL